MPEWTLRAETASVPTARRLALEALDDLPRNVADSVALVVSELVTNCIRHAQTEFQLKVERGADGVEIEVTDRGQGQPAVMSPAPGAAHGRGLQIVQALANRWGVVAAPSGSGKTVWCSVAV